MPSRRKNYQLDPSLTLSENFRLLAAQRGLKKKTEEYKSARKAFFATHAGTVFYNHFGSNAASLEAWRAICETIGIPDASFLTSVRRCKKSLHGIYVNLIDLVDAKTKGTTISRTFSSEDDLRDYIKETDKVYPLRLAKGNPLLEHFLIHVF